MSENMSEQNKSDEKSSAISKSKSQEARLVFFAVAIIAFVWFCLFIALPALTGKAGVAQKMQQDLQQKTSDGETGR